MCAYVLVSARACVYVSVFMCVLTQQQHSDDWMIFIHHTHAVFCRIMPSACKHVAHMSLNHILLSNSHIPRTLQLFFLLLQHST